jgi:GNAT superfamily N-acetyltransferase
MQITPATPSDIPALCDLLDLLFSQEADFYPDHAAQARGLGNIINDPGVGHILVARQEGRVQGMVSLLYTISTALGGRVALLEDMVVVPQARGAGLGSRLLAQAIQVARAHGCLRITLLTDRANEPAQRFYQRHGFGLSAMTPMRLLLGD